MLITRSFLGLGLLAAVCVCSAAQAATYHVIYRFTGPPDGDQPLAGLTVDDQGRLYGTTQQGGALGFGTVFRLTRPISGVGSWTEEILHSFSGTDGMFPESSLLLGLSGEIYGTTLQGGALGLGVVYRLDNLSGWPITILHTLAKADGRSASGVVFGPQGLLYGSVPGGGLRGGGTAFSLSPLGDAVEYSIIDKFAIGSGGKGPSPLVVTLQEKLLGVTATGGQYGQGTAFSLALNNSGVWRSKTLFDFGAQIFDIRGPESPLVVGRGVLKGQLVVCGDGGMLGQGAVYALLPGTGSAAATETMLYSFGEQKNDPSTYADGKCGLTQDSTGKLYGTTAVGGAFNNGAFFELDPPQAGATSWTETVLYNFNAKGNNGTNPYGAPLRVGGLFYGTTISSTESLPTTSGTVWEMTP